MKKIFTYFLEVKTELRKVTWPNKIVTSKLTFTVFSISALVGLYVGLLDVGFTKLLEFLISR